MDAGTLDRRITLLARSAGRDPKYNTPSGAWAPVAENIAANVQDFLPSKGERVAEGINITSRPVRIRIRYRAGVTSAMRVQFGARTLEIVAGPAELGRRDGLEFVAQEVSSTGDTA